MFGGSASDKVQFVAGNYSGAAPDSDDDMFCDEPNVVLTRSSPTPNLLAVAPVARVAEVKQEAAPYDGAMVDVEYSASVKTVVVPAAAATDAAGGFSSISDRFPLSKVGKVSCGVTKQVFCTPQEPKMQPIPMSRLLNATPEMTQVDQMTVLVEDGTVDDNTIKAEPEGATTTTFVAGSSHVQQQQMSLMSDVYRYQATDVEENEMEVRGLTDAAYGYWSFELTRVEFRVLCSNSDGTSKSRFSRDTFNKDRSTRSGENWRSRSRTFIRKWRRA
ncbi:unnamed protein product [Phytophthora lilii]|uniref:Unnamed protein product n=1 Tax=Phytophthora lilii TaxID=2077276 RepID=A0A9W6WX35_9STRA|nr:unnamed protein product [Phytophthora lilii]